LKYEQLHHEAKHIDRLIELNLHVRKSQFIPQENLKTLILAAFPDFYVENSGWHKIVFGNRNMDHQVVLKVGPKKSIEGDHQAYQHVPKNVRHQFFARIFWHTKYCLLQQYGEPAYVTATELNCLRRAVYKYGIVDVKEENLRMINGDLRIIDANLTRIPLPNLVMKVDEIKPRLPKRIDLLLNRISKLIKKQ
jgi:hypothetical protein